MMAQDLEQRRQVAIAAARAARAGSDLVWCIDPLDGTTNFLKGAHNWCVSIGLLDHGIPVFGRHL